MSSNIEMVFLYKLNQSLHLLHKMFGEKITMEPVVFGTPCFMTINIDGKTGLIAYTAEPISKEIAVAIQTYYNNLLEETSDSLPGLRVYGAQRTREDWQDDKPYITEGASSIFKEMKKDIAERYPDKEFLFSTENLLDEIQYE